MRGTLRERIVSEHDGLRDAGGSNFARARNAEVVVHGAIQDVLAGERRIKARVEIGRDTARPMALRTIGIEIGAHARLQ